MPYTINGIGTHYYGRRNVSSSQGTCDQCGRAATLTSYDTREFFCLVFIPIIPLQKFRIFDECSSCRRHRRMPLGAFNDVVNDTIAPLRENVTRSPQDADARHVLVSTLYEHRMTVEAEAVAREAVTAIPSSFSLNLVAGQIIAQRGDLAAATPFLEKAVQLESQNADARYSLAHVLFLQKMPRESVRHAEEAYRLDNGDHDTKLLLGELYVQLERWSDALNIYQQLAMTTQHKVFVARVAECKKKLGYQLTDVERKASRKWWPFGRQTAGNANLRTAIVFAAIVLVVVSSVIGYALWQQKHVAVYFDSAIPGTTVRVAGEQFALDHPPVERTLRPGDYEVRVTGKDGREIEKTKIAVGKPEFWDAITGDRVYVYSVAGARVYRRAVIGYAASQEDASYSETLIANKKFFEVENYDYLFRSAPETVQMSQSAKTEIKVVFDAADDLSLVDYATIRVAQRNAKEAEATLKTALRLQPCNVEARQIRFGLLYQRDPHASLDFAKQWIADCPQNSIDAHRSYQHTREALGQKDAVIAEYRDRMSANPGSAVDHYLYGRLLVDSDAAIAEQREAIRLDPKLSWGHAALGYQYLANGRYGEAMQEFAETSRLRRDDPMVITHYVYSAIGAGKTAEAYAMVKPATSGSQLRFAVWSGRWSLLLADRKWSEAAKMLDELGPDRLEPSAWAARAQLLALSGRDAELKTHLGAARRVKALEAPLAVTEIEMLLAEGRYAEVNPAIDASRNKLADAVWTYDLYGAAASMLSGDANAAAARLTSVRAKIAANQSLNAHTRQLFDALLQALEGKGEESHLVDVIADTDLERLRHLYFFLGARAYANDDRASAKRYFAKSAETSFDQAFPLLAARKLAS